MAFLGIDLGTSFIKAAVLDLDASELRQVRRMPFPEPLRLPDPLRVEFDPAGIAATVKQLIDELAASSGPYEGVVMCAQMSCLILMDERAEARSNCIGWRDQRALEPHPSGAGSYYDVLTRRLTAQQKRELGNELPPGAPICFLFWMAEKGLLEPGLVPVSLADFVLASLCGCTPSVESTNAMAYGLLQLESLRWHAEVIKALGLERLNWPPILRHGEVVGNMKVGASQVPCYTPVGDYQCALAGSLIEEGELSLNISTGSQVSQLTGRLVPGNYQTRPFFDQKFTNTLSHLPAGRSLNVLVDLLVELGQSWGTAIPDPWDYIARAASAVDHTDLEVKLSFFAGPMGDKGSISNIREQNLTVGTLFRAAFENMAQNYYDCALRILPDRSWNNIVFSGGLGRKMKLLRRIIERKFQTGSRLCPLEEDTMLGMMILARVFSHRSESVHQAMDDVRCHYANHPATKEEED